jgi:hypothetical protein
MTSPSEPVTIRGTWKARVNQDFEIEADTREQAEALLMEEMSPRNVVELTDFEWEIDDDEA